MEMVAARIEPFSDLQFARERWNDIGKYAGLTTRGQFERGEFRITGARRGDRSLRPRLA